MNRYFISIFILINVIAYFYHHRNYNYLKNSQFYKLSNERELDNVFLVQLSDPTEFMLQRAIKYQKYRSKKFDVFYIFDSTNNYEIPKEFKNYFLKNVHRFNSCDYYSRYPNTKDLIENCPRIRTVRKGNEYRYIAYLSLAERINELYKEKKLKTKFIWTLEQDTAVTGNLVKIMEYFNNFDVDYIAKQFRRNSYIYRKNLTDKWIFYHCLSNKLKTFLDNKSVSTSKIFFTRFSKNFMNYLNIFMLNGYHGVTEFLYPTIVSTYNLTSMEFPERYIYKNSHAGTRFKKEEYYHNHDKELFMHSLKE